MQSPLNNTHYIRFILIIVIGATFLQSCTETYTPKPRGYFRIELPEHKYTLFDNKTPFSFEIPTYSHIVHDTTDMAEPYWYNLEFPALKGKIHLSYKPIKNNLSKYIEDSRTLAYKHIIKADDILEHPFINKDNNVIAIMYEIKGNAASSFQFFATDSAKHFLRGSLYFNVYPNKDSLAPVFEFIQVDIKHLIETIKWKE